jgi:chromosome segregation ATPase
MNEIKPEDRQDFEKYEQIVNDLLEQISERNRRISVLSSQLQVSEEREKKMNEQLAILSEQVTELKRQLSATNKLQKMMLEIRRRLLPGGKHR